LITNNALQPLTAGDVLVGFTLQFHTTFGGDTIGAPIPAALIGIQLLARLGESTSAQHVDGGVHHVDTETVPLKI